MKQFIGIALFIVVYGSGLNPSYADSEVESLSPELRSLLQQEMIAIEQAMQDIIPAYISGDLDRIEKVAQQMENSFILKQKITEAQKQELHDKLPEAFIEKDKQSHYYAGKLRQVSRDNQVDLVGFYYTRLLESCISCHGTYATHRFPGLKRRSSEIDAYY